MTRLIVLPGMDGTGMLLDSFISALGSRFNVKVVCYPSNNSWGYAELEAFARAALPENVPFFILGESFSGPLAVRIALERPAQVKGLILCGSFVLNPRPGLAWLKPFLRILPFSGVAVAALGNLLLGRNASRQMRTEFAETLSKIPPATLQARLRSVLGVNVSAQYAALDLPILYLRAIHDRVVPHTASELALQLNPRTRISDIDAPHFLLQSAPVQAAQAISAFVGEIADTTPATPKLPASQSSGKVY